ncbi:MAG: efflux RND transporter permease subunit, partial [Planctomycetota bacterium]
MEDQVTYPLTVQLLGVPGVRTIRSSSMFGFSSVYVIFEEGIDFYWSRSRILEKLNSLPRGALPQNVQPTLGPDATALGQIFWYTLEGRDLQGRPVGGWDLQELRSIQDWQVRYALQSAGGVAEVASVGGYVREYQVDVDPDAMRAYDVTLHQVAQAVASSNIDVGARTLEMNSVEYFIRSVGFIKQVDDIEQTVVAVHDNVPVLVSHVATVTLGPALRRGVLDKDGAEAVGGVVVARYGVNPLRTINNTKAVMHRIAPGLPARVVIDHDAVDDRAVRDYAEAHGFPAYLDDRLNHDAWVEHLVRLQDEGRLDEAPRWARVSRVTIVPFYDRTGLIYETLNTLNEALVQQALITVVVVILMMMHLRSSLLISSMLPLAVLMTFVAMRASGVDANIVALSGIAIAIGTIVDMGIVLCENIIRHLEGAPPEADRLQVVHRAAAEVGGAVLTAAATTVISFLPVFAMTGSEGKLFRPLAWTKTFALVASVVVALTVIAPAALSLLARPAGGRTARLVGRVLGITAGVALVLIGAIMGWVFVVLLGVLVLGIVAWRLAEAHLPRWLTRHSHVVVNLAVVVLVVALLGLYWVPLGPARSGAANILFVALAIAVLLGGFWLFHRAYASLLRWSLRHKVLFMSLPTGLVVFALFVWLGFEAVAPWALLVLIGLAALVVVLKMTMWIIESGTGRRQRRDLLLSVPVLVATLCLAGVAAWLTVVHVLPAETDKDTAGQWIRSRRGWVTLSHALPGLGREFMPPLDEGSFLYMPTTMVHVGLGEARDILALQDRAFRAIPEVDQVVGKIGRVESALDPAPVSMIETVITYKDEYRIDDRGNRVRQWRDHIQTPDDIWKEISRAGRIPGVTTAPKLQPIAARIVMLQSGIRAPMAFRIQGDDLETIEAAGLQIQKLLKQDIPGIDPST